MVKSIHNDNYDESSTPEVLLRSTETRQQELNQITQFRLLVESAHDGICIVTRKGISFINGPLLELLGYESVHALMQEPALKLMRRHSTRRGAALFRKVAKILRGLDHRSELKDSITAKDGSTRRIHIFFESVVFEQQRGALLTIRDVTEELEMRKQLVNAQQLASLGTLAASVAHEINNPLAYVTTNISYCVERLRYLQELLSGQQLGVENPQSLLSLFQPIEQALAEAHDGTQRITTIVRELKAMTRKDIEQEKPVNLQDALESAIHLVESKFRFRMRIEHNLVTCESVTGSETGISQIFVNLLVNAAQAFTFDDPKNNLISVRHRHDGDFQVIEVEDNGPGIPERIIDQVFDPYFTTKPVGTGTGLGLSISTQLAESMKGKIELESRPNQGTTFRVFLPASIETAPPSTLSHPLPPHMGRGRILLIDDEPLILRAMSRILSEQHEVITAGNGMEAFRILSKPIEYDLIICDLMMPELNGMELYQRVARYFPELTSRFIFLTGGAFTVEARDFLKQIDNPKLDKPIQPNLLRDVVASLLLS